MPSYAEPSPTPTLLGVHLADGGVTVGIFAGHATGIEFCLVGDEGGAPDTHFWLAGPADGVWHGFIPGVTAGQQYGFRVHGEWNPGQGHRHNPAKLLLDPYARGIVGELTKVTKPGAPSLFSNEQPFDSAPFVPRSVVMPELDTSWQAPKPGIPWEHTVIYEAHVKGLTQQLPGVPEHLRGTYAGMGHPATIEHLTGLGVTTLELLPIQAFADEPHLEELGLTNYWGYSTMGFFAPHPGYATEEARRKGADAVRDECAGMIDLLHRAGIEVVLDVVYNHTAEGGGTGRQIEWRGIDNLTYYRSHPKHPGRLDDTTGTGNTLDFAQPRVQQMALDSLRYWADEMKVDGFRFDLAVTLGRTGKGFSPEHPFLTALVSDPILGASKLIAEPWDVGMGGWQTGNFPQPFVEWNDRFRDTVRAFWLGDAVRDVGAYAPEHGTASALATRLAGSSDLFADPHDIDARPPIASVNFVACHDGFTIRDLTEYNDKHNEANGEQNRDGSSNNNSWNHGVEGSTLDEGLGADRRKSIRNMLGTLLLSAGTPMILAGDELGHTQHGNNNAYCQDNAMTWLGWAHEPWQDHLQETVAHLIALRHEHPVLRPMRFYEGRDLNPDDANPRTDVAWYTANGRRASKKWWNDPHTRVMQMRRSGAGLGTPESPASDATILINGSPNDAQVRMRSDKGPAWHLVWDSTWDELEFPGTRVRPGTVVPVAARSMQLYVT